jgi:hypothetical protein
MNATTDTRTARTARSTSRRIRLLGLLATVVGLFGPAVALAEPAAAAGSYSTGIAFCAPYQNSTVQLQIWNGRWQGYKNGSSGPGCATFRYVDAGYSYRVVMPFSTACSSGTYATTWKVSQANVVVNVGRMALETHYRWC